MIYSIAACFVAFAIAFGGSFPACHMFQLEGYKGKGYVRWLSFSGLKYYWLLLVAAVLYIASGMLFFLESSTLLLVLAILALLLAAGAGVFYILKTRVKNAKKALAYTARVKRLLATTGILLALFSTAGYFAGVIVLAIVIALTPLWIVVANWLNQPMEKGVQRHYLNEAKAKIEARPKLIKIGITGSYGKTSTKFLLGTLLKEKYNVLVPPSSYNTPMGLTRVIREQLEDGHQVFIAEMGAKHIGDIRELVELVHPKYGIVTSVGPQHLETFGSLENVYKTKYELIEGLPSDGVAFFPDDGSLTRRMYDETKIAKRLFSVEKGEADVWAEDMKTDASGCQFTLHLPDGSFFTAKTRLLGKHNIQNLLGCVAIAYELGLTPEELKRGMEKVEPVEHRLQLIPTNNGVTVIDDAFNANPVGAARAMEVLEEFPGRKIVVTPGMVELGAVEEQENRAFGRRMAQAADLVFLVGEKHTRPILEGLLEEGFKKEAVQVHPTLAAATAAMGRILRAGDVVLFENDLPDNYNE